MKYLIVGDLHGDLEVFKRATEFADSNDYTIVQVGDLVDSFEFKPRDQAHLVHYCIERKVDNKDDIYLMGNHDLSYMHPYHRCSGYNQRWEYLFYQLLKELDQKPYFMVDNVLITHAGLHPYFLDSDSNTIEGIRETLEKKTNNIVNDIFHAGASRGGSLPHGGITWNDWNRDFMPIPNLNQVVGHTNVHFIDLKEEKNSKNFNVDCLLFNEEFLEYDTVTKEFTVIQI